MSHICYWIHCLNAFPFSVVSPEPFQWTEPSSFISLYLFSFVLVISNYKKKKKNPYLSTKKGKFLFSIVLLKTKSEWKLSGPCTDSKLGLKEVSYCSQRIKYITLTSFEIINIWPRLLPDTYLLLKRWGGISKTHIFKFMKRKLICICPDNQTTLHCLY